MLLIILLPLRFLLAIEPSTIDLILTLILAIFGPNI